MADIVDAFVVSLGIDATAYNDEIKKYREDRKKLAEENRSYGQQEEDTQKRSAEGIRKLRNETAGFVLLLAGATGFQQFAANMLTSDAATGRFAANIGMATERLGVWEEALKKVGGTSGDAQSALRALYGIFLDNQLTGDRSHSAGLAVFGLTERDLENPEQALLKMAERAQTMDRGIFTERLNRLGINDATVTLLAEGRPALEALLAEVERMGVASDDSAKAAQEFDKALADISQTIRGLARPAVTGLAEELVRFSQEVEGAIQSLSNAYRQLPSGLIGFFQNIGNMMSGGDYKNFWDYVGEATEEYGGGIIKERYGSQGKGPPGGNLDPFLGLGRGSSTPPIRGSSGRAPARKPRGQRAVALDGNNPGGINDGSFARSQRGYVGNNGRYAAFATMEDGIAAQRNLLASYVRRGFDTPAKIARRWAPNEDGNDSAAYAAQIARRMGIGVNDRIGAGQLNAFQNAQAIAENVQYTRRIARPGPQGRTNVSSANQTNSTTVGQINVYTSASNATDITQNLREAMTKRGLVVQAGSGLKP